MHEGRVVYFEDSEHIRDFVRRELKKSPHELVAEAATLAEALDVLGRIQSGQIDANVVITDGNLDRSTNTLDALIITNRIRQMGLAVRVIGLAGESVRDAGVVVDIDLTKDRLSPGQIAKAIDELPEPD